MEHWLYYIIFVICYAASDFISIWGMFYTLKYPDMGMVESYIKAVPFAWLSWIFTSVAVHIGDKYKLTTPTQDTLFMIIDQFIATLLVNKYWLKQPVTRSDYVTFFLILVGFYISVNNVASKTELGKAISDKLGLHTSKKAD